MLAPGPAIWCRYLVDALLFQKVTQALIVKANGLGNMSQRHPALDQLAARVTPENGQPISDSWRPFHRTTRATARTPAGRGPL